MIRPAAYRQVPAPRGQAAVGRAQGGQHRRLRRAVRVHAAGRRRPLGTRKVLFAAEILDILARRIRPRVIPVPNADTKAPAADFAYGDGKGHVGMIASVSRPFCMSCNRVRLTAEASRSNCLFALGETDVRALLRGSDASDATIARTLLDSVRSKWEGHEINTARFIKPDRLMHSIGG